MPEFQLEFATRHIKRAFGRAVGKSIPKILTELITNADDSYRRIEQCIREADKKAPLVGSASIAIFFERHKRRFVLVDHAEGLTDKEMEEHFVTYGQESSDRSIGLRTRSLFGKGLRDVLFTQHHGQVKSIKNGLFYNCQFRWKQISGQERPVVDIKAPARVTEELRRALDIPANGTAVEFKLADGVPTPQTPKLQRELSRFYMLRMINSHPYREVRLKVIGPGGRIQLDEQLGYQFPVIDVKVRVDEDLMTDIKIPIKIKGEIGLTEEELSQGEVGYVDREGGLLITDENDAVLDLHLFGYDEDPAARRISGRVQLGGAGEYIRAKLNASEPEEVLTETRDGFDKNHPFYRALREKIKPHLTPVVAKLRELGPQPKIRLSDQTQERHKQALSLLNKLADDMLGITARVPVVPGSKRTPPVDGIAFGNSHITVQAGVSTPIALLINTAICRPPDSIEVKSDNRGIDINPKSFPLTEPHDDSGLAIKIIRIYAEIHNLTGKVTACWRDKQAVVNVTTTDRVVITPANGLEFERDEYNVRLGATRNLRLFVDLEKVPIDSPITVVADGSAIQVIKRDHNITKDHTITEQIAAIEIGIKGASISKATVVTASFDEYVAGTKVSVTKKEQPERGKHGLFKDYKFEPLGRKLQSFLTGDGLILINTKDPVNIRYFGNEPLEAVDKNVHCQVRLADLILTECLWAIVSQALEAGKLDRRFPDNPETDVRNYVDEKKFEIGPDFHKLIVTKIE